MAHLLGTNPERDLAIVAAYEAGGVTPAELGRRHGLTGWRITQIVRKADRISTLVDPALAADETPIERVRLSARAHSTLREGGHGIDWRTGEPYGRSLTVGEVRRMSDKEIMALPMMGRKTLAEVREKLG